MRPLAPRILLFGGSDRATAAVAARLSERAATTGLEVVEIPPGAPPPAGAIAACVYLASSRSGRPLVPDRADAESVLASIAQHDVDRAILVSHAAVFPASHRHPGLVGEGRRPVRARRHAIASAWLALERTFAARFGRELLVLRVPPSELSRRPGGWVPTWGGWTLVLPGRDPTIPVLDPEDLARAVAAAVVVETEERVLHLAPRAPAPLRRALRAAHARLLAVPAWLQRLVGAAGRDELDFGRYSWTLAGERGAQRLGVAPLRTTLEAVAGAAAAPPVADRPVEWFGLDRDWIARRGWLFRFLYRRYWRIRAEGLENVPPEGAAMLVGTHRGFMPWDAIMALWGMDSRRGRVPRFLVHPGLLLPPFVSTFITRLGGVPANRDNAERLLQGGELVGVFPEGVHGAFRRYRDRRQVGRFPSLEFLRVASRRQVPVVPFVTVGSAESMPVFAQIGWRWWRRLSEWPCLPVALPWPLPLRWRARYLPARRITGGDEAAIRQAAEALRLELQATMDALYAARRRDSREPS